ncbi:MAG: chromosome partitioning protein [Microbacterium sp.]
MKPQTGEPVVNILSGTSAEVVIDGISEQITAADSPALQARFVEAVRQVAASAGTPVTATIVEGSSRYPLVVNPDGSIGDPAPAIPPRPARLPEPGALTAAGALQRSSSSGPKPTVDDLLASRDQPAGDRGTIGWPGFVRRITNGRVTLKPNKQERQKLERERAVKRRLDGSRTIVILNPKGGAHKTTSTLLLAETLGTLRGGSTLAWDNNETRGTLGWRARSTPHSNTAVDLLDNLDQFADLSRASLAQLDGYVRAQVDSRFDVLASDEDAAASSTIDAEAFDRLHAMLARYYRMIVIDTGNNMRASNWVAAVAAADQLVIVSTVREDTAASAAWLLDGLREKGFGAKIDEAVTVLASPSDKTDRRLRNRLDSHFSQVTAVVEHVPYDPALVDGGPVDFDALSPETRDAWLTVAATIAARL